MNINTEYYGVPAGTSYSGVYDKSSGCCRKEKSTRKKKSVLYLCFIMLQSASISNMRGDNPPPAPPSSKDFHRKPLYHGRTYSSTWIPSSIAARGTVRRPPRHDHRKLVWYPIIRRFQSAPGLNNQQYRRCWSRPSSSERTRFPWLASKCV